MRSKWLLPLVAGAALLMSADQLSSLTVKHHTSGQCCRTDFDCGYPDHACALDPTLTCPPHTYYGMCE